MATLTSLTLCSSGGMAAVSEEDKAAIGMDAQSGDPWSQAMLASIESQAHNYEASHYWAKLSAEQGNPLGEFLLAEQYFYGRGTKQDYTKALIWYKKSAKQNIDASSVWAQWRLGEIYENGDGVKKNLDEAIKWYEEAAKNGDEPAKVKLKELKKK